jgi:N-acetylneuraminate synthase
MAAIAELDETITTAKQAGCQNLILLKCTSSYPSTPKDTNLLTIPHLRDLFDDIQVGLSDHTLGIGVAVASVALGATVIEKHFTLNRADGGVDAAFSMEPQEMKQLVIETERAWQAMGKISYGVTPAEQKSLIFRRSLYIAQNMQSGDILTPDNLRAIRPGQGLPPKYYNLLLGKKIKVDVQAGTPVKWELLM